MSYGIDNDPDATVVELAQRYAALQEAREAIDGQLDVIKHKLRGLGAGRHDAGPLVVTVTPNRRIDEAKVRELYPPATNASLYTLKPDVKEIRASLAPNDVDALMVEVGDPKVVVK